MDCSLVVRWKRLSRVGTRCQTLAFDPIGSEYVDSAQPHGGEWA